MRTTYFIIMTSAIVSSTSLLFSGTALFMDGDGDYLNLFEPVIAKAPFTVEGWAFMASSGGGTYEENCLFEQRSNDTGFGAATVTLLAKNAHQDEASFELRDSESGRTKLAGPIQPLNEWHHYAGVADNAAIKFYIDGILVKTLDITLTGTLNWGIDNISIGRHAYLDIVAGYFNGYIDEMRIWDYARSEGEIRDGMYRTIDLSDEGEASHLLAYWRFDDFYEFWQDGEQYVGVKDLSGNGHHGAFVDDAWLKPADTAPTVVPLVDFHLLSPQYDQVVLTDSPVLEWESATIETHLLNSELQYTVFIGETPTFENAMQWTTFGNQTQVQVSGLSEGAVYFWAVKARNIAAEEKWSETGRFSVANMTDVPEHIPAQFALRQNFPNPFNPNTMIQFYIPYAVQGSLAIYDLLGRRVTLLVNGGINPGMNTFYWHGTDENGDSVSAGVYLCRLDVFPREGGRRTIIRKMTLLN